MKNHNKNNVDTDKAVSAKLEPPESNKSGTGNANASTKTVTSSRSSDQAGIVAPRIQVDSTEIEPPSDGTNNEEIMAVAEQSATSITEKSIAKTMLPNTTPTIEQTTKFTEDMSNISQSENSVPTSKPVVAPIANQSKAPATAAQTTPAAVDQATNPTTDNSGSQAAENNKVSAQQIVTPITSNAEVSSRPAQATAPPKRALIDITPYLKLMVEQEGSDMYFTCGARVQIKINGVSLSIGSNKLPKGSVKDILPGILNDRQLAEFEEEMELDTAFDLDNVGRFRINVLRQRGEVALVIRQIKAKIPSVKELQLPLIIEDLIMEPRGLIIIAGATGTGKSTTVASMIDHRNSRRSGHILTIEDPIEFIHDHKLSIVNQREVGLDTKSFKEALRRAMREAPDVIMIGEIRDAETMQQALSYADTGHLCIATLHATNTTQCMERIIGLFPEANRNQVFMDLSNNLRAIVCQRLLVGTDKTRIPATEILLNEPMVRKLILEGSIHKLKEVIEKAPPESPLHSFDNDMLRLYLDKKVSMEEALNHVDEPDHFKLKVNLGGGGISSSADDIFSV